MAGITWQWRKVDQARALQARTLHHLQWQEIGHWLGEGQESRALAYLASLIRERPERWQAAMYAMSIVEQHSFPVRAGPETRPPAALTAPACLSPDGSWQAAAGEDLVVRIWEGASGREMARLPQTSAVTAMATGTGPVSLTVAAGDGGLAVYPHAAAPPVPLRRLNPEPVWDTRRRRAMSMCNSFLPTVENVMR